MKIPTERELIIVLKKIDGIGMGEKNALIKFISQYEAKEKKLQETEAKLKEANKTIAELYTKLQDVDDREL